MTNLEFIIPVKPLSINKAYKVRRFSSDDLKQFEKDVGYLLKAQKCPITDEITIDYTFYIKNYQATDVSNCVKTIEDMLVKCLVIKDDKQVVQFSARKIKSEEEKIEITIKPYVT
jgi:Holliday junction resolvase RusA-like endonuclease